MKLFPKYIVVSGIDGSGKTSVINELRLRLEDKGIESHYLWLRYSHIIVKPVHMFCRLVGLSRKHDSAQGVVWRHEFYRSQLFCSIYIFLTWLDTWLGRMMVAWQLRRANSSIIVCDRWVNDILIDLAVDSRRGNFLNSPWHKRFQRILPADTVQFVIVRDSTAVLDCRPECRDDPDFQFRQGMYNRLREIPGEVITISNDGDLETTVNNLVAHLGITARA